MMQDELKEYLLNNVPMCKPASGGRFVVTKCPFCGDGKHTTSTHFYIGLGYNDSSPFGYCHLCHTYTRITPYFLNTYLSISDQEISSILYKLNKNNKYKPKNIFNIQSVKNNIVSDNEINRLKLSYINKRLGLDLSYKDLVRLKIVLSIGEFLNYNNITSYTRDIRVMESLDKYFLGFLSTDNAFINMRNLSKKGVLYKSLDKKYINYNIFKEEENFLRFYTLPNSINLNNPNPIKIHLAEGVFDILSIYFNMRKDLSHDLYSSCGGTGYLNVIKHYINGYGLINVEWHIYRDTEGVEDYIFENIIDYLLPFDNPIYFHDNIYPGEKDFGVPLNKIDEKIERVL